MPSYAHLYQHTETRERRSEHRCMTQTNSWSTNQHDHSNQSSISEHARLSDPSKTSTLPSNYYASNHSDAPNHRSSDEYNRRTSTTHSVKKSHHILEVPDGRQKEATLNERKRGNEWEGSKTRVLQQVDMHNKTVTPEGYEAKQRVKSMPEVTSFAKKILSPNAHLPIYAELTASPTVRNSQTYGNYAELKPLSLCRLAYENDFTGDLPHFANNQQAGGQSRNASQSSNVRQSVMPKFHCTTSHDGRTRNNGRTSKPYGLQANDVTSSSRGDECRKLL
ncbi:hypothetical protein Tcan_04331 [Toxocara canis]|uniref:Uncharacterized protein n=2 Tax=Toxocara canis TaxID=6265 RepID=A0A0B2VQB1_TOXCA|nr:hypothetical protein Tcan_04331 [Toxocara canis]VDM45512.1 unnamed protein product [Toxocara canis]